MKQKKVGETLKIIRKNKGISQKKFCGNIINRSFYSKVERNLYNISAEKLLLIIDYNNIKLDEFVFIKNNYTLLDKEKLSYEIYLNYISMNTAVLLNLKKKCHNLYINTQDKPYLHLEFFCIACLNNFSLQKKEEDSYRIVSNYLFSLETWNYYELRLFNIFLFSFNDDQLSFFLKYFIKRSNIYLEYMYPPESLYISVIINLITKLIDTNFDKHKISIKKLIDLLNTKTENLDMQNYTKFMFIKGIIKFLDNDRKKGLIMCEKAIHIFSDTNMIGLSKRYKFFFEKIVATNREHY